MIFVQKMKTFAVFVHTILMVSALSDEEQWQEFKEKYNKNYKSILHDTTRFQIFQSHLREINEHNEIFAQGKTSYKLGITKFADMSQKAFVNRLNSLVDITNDEIFAVFPPSAEEDVPDEIDWREKGAVTRVKDQRDCISSWAFAATGSLEAQYFLTKGQLVPLSEQYLIDCNTEKNFGCGGGKVVQAYLYIREFGTVTEESYPYQGDDGTCNATGTIFKGLGFAAIDNDENELKKIVGIVGPAVASIDATNLSLYSEGVYYNPNCKSDTTNHQVLVVGYGTTDDGIDYWLIRNSWGEGWGERGYLKLIRNKNNHCGIVNSPVYPILMTDDPNIDPRYEQIDVASYLG